MEVLVDMVEVMEVLLIHMDSMELDSMVPLNMELVLMEQHRMEDIQADMEEEELVIMDHLWVEEVCSSYILYYRLLFQYQVILDFII